MTAIQSLKCPNCAGAISKESASCRYCGTKVMLSADGQRLILVGCICPVCGENNKEEYNFCKRCSHSLLRTCPPCKRKVPLDSVHCPFCGKNIEILETEKKIQDLELLISQVESTIRDRQPPKPFLQRFLFYTCGFFCGVAALIFVFIVRQSLGTGVSIAVLTALAKTLAALAVIGIAYYLVSNYYEKKKIRKPTAKQQYISGLQEQLETFHRQLHDLEFELKKLKREESSKRRQAEQEVKAGRRG